VGFSTRGSGFIKDGTGGNPQKGAEGKEKGKAKKEKEFFPLPNQTGSLTVKKEKTPRR